MRPEQMDQVSKQIAAYESQKQTKIVEIPFGPESLKLEIDPQVADPEIMNSGIQVIKFLVERPDIVKGKVVTDMGTGSGIIGIGAAKLGAVKVFMPDIDVKAVANADKNVKLQGLTKVCETFPSDLFNNYGNRPKSDVQIFNHPFFSGQPMEGKEWTRMMMGGLRLIGEYLKEAPNYSKPETKYVLPWLTLAGNDGEQLDNDPGKRAKDFGYKVVDIVEQAPVRQGIQQHLFKIYVLEKI